MKKKKMVTHYESFQVHAVIVKRDSEILCWVCESEGFEIVMEMHKNEMERSNFSGSTAFTLHISLPSNQPIHRPETVTKNDRAKPAQLIAGTVATATRAKIWKSHWRENVVSKRNKT